MSLETISILSQRFTSFCIHITLITQFSACMCAKSLQSCRLFTTLQTVAHQASLSMGFSRQKYRRGLPISPLGDPPDPGIEPLSLAFPTQASGFFTTSASWEAHVKSSQVKLLAQSCLTLCNPMDGSPPGSSIHGILQARILEWVAISFSRRSSRPRDQTQVSRIAGRRFNL